MSRRKTKMWLRVGLVGCVGLIGLLALAGTGRIMSDVTRSDETAAVLNVAAVLDPELVGAVTWAPDPDGLPNDLPPVVREALTDTWLRAWSQFAILADGRGPVGSTLDGEVTDGVAEYFDGAAGEAMLASPDAWLGRPVHQVAHDLQLNFFSDDGSVASISSTKSTVLRSRPVGDSQQWYLSDEQYDALFVLDNDSWRLHHLVRTDASGAWVGARSAVTPVPFEHDGLRASAWTPTTENVADFIADPDLGAEQQRLEIAKASGFNAIRLPLPFDELDGRDVDGARLSSYQATMDLALDVGLDVVLAPLADRFDHSPSRFDADADHLEAVARVLGDHPSLVLWELASTPDRDLGIAGVDADMLDAWLHHTTSALRSADPDTPVMATWSSPSAAVSSIAWTDVVGVTWSDDTSDQIEELRAALDEQVVLLAGSDRDVDADAVALTQYGTPVQGTSDDARLPGIGVLALGIGALVLGWWFVRFRWRTGGDDSHDGTQS